MTNFLKSYTLKYTPLSPLHIGTGESYEPTNYVIDNGTLYEFDTGGAVAGLTANDRAELLKISSGKPDTQMLKSLQKFFYERREILKPWAANCIPVLDGVSKLYANRVAKTAHQESGGKEVINKLEIDRTAYNPVTHKPVLFGSSVKGAIRTALLNKINNGAQAREHKGLHEFQGRLLKYRDPDYGKLQLEKDPLRLISFSDAGWKNLLGLPSAQIYLAVNRKKTPVTNEQGQLRPAMGENLSQILECVPAYYPQAFAGQLTIQQINLPTHSGLPATDLRFSAEEIAQACNGFYLPILNAERKLLRDRAYTHAEWDNTISQVLRISEEKIKNNQAFLLRVGRHSGAESVTVNGARNGNIKIIKGKGQPPEFADSPKTVWLAAQSKDQRTDLMPFGWLLVEILPIEKTANEWTELATLCEANQTEAKRWAETQAKQQASLTTKRQQAQQRKQQEETARQQKEQQVIEEQQAKLAQQQAEQRRLANLSPIEQELEVFLKPFPLQEHDTKLLQELDKGRWQGTDVAIVAEKIKNLMEQANKWLPDFTGSNAQKVKLKERSQKVLNYIDNA